MAEASVAEEVSGGGAEFVGSGTSGGGVSGGSAKRSRKAPSARNDLVRKIMKEKTLHYHKLVNILKRTIYTPRISL